MSDPGPICVVDDDSAVRDALRILLRMSGYRVEVFESALAFLGLCISARTFCQRRLDAREQICFLERLL